MDWLDMIHLSKNVWIGDHGKENRIYRPMTCCDAGDHLVKYLSPLMNLSYQDEK
jgi:hypothetical protein